MSVPVPTTFEPRRLAYPDTLRTDQVDLLHGVPVSDPYRWLEDLDSPETRAWVHAQNRLAAEYLGTLPGREGLRRRLAELWDFPRWGTPFRKGGRYFFVRHDGLRDQCVLYTQDSLEGEPRVTPSAAYMAATVIWGTGFALLVSVGRRFVGPCTFRAIGVASGLSLGGFACYLAVSTARLAMRT